MKKLFLLIIVLAGLMACSNEDVISSEQQSAQVQVYHVSIPATIDDGTTRAVSFDNSGATPTITSTFSADEKVYVYNKTTGTFLSTFTGPTEWEGYLSPTNISADGKRCTLTGNITGSLSENDELLLLYNVNETGDGPLSHFAYDYYSQRGTAAQLIDGATAEVYLDSYTGNVLTTKTTASFTNLQSLFRFQFSYNDAPLSVQKLIIRSGKGALENRYAPLTPPADPEGPISYGSTVITPTSATSDYLYASLLTDESKSSGDQLMFTVIGSDGYVYRTTKAAPSGGFKNGKYYFNSSSIAIPRITQDKAPDITWTSPTSCSPTSKFYWVTNENVDVELSGTGYGYRFQFSKAANVRFDNLTYWYDGSNIFIQVGSNGNLDFVLDINGTNNITTVEDDRPIFAWGNLKLKGYGTLTVTVKGTDYAGIYGFKNYGSSSADPSNLAADGYTVTRSARTDNPDGTYTWTYTVSGPPANAINGKFTINAGGDQVYFSQGNLQATYNGTSWTWAFAAHQYDYIGNAAANNAINGDGTVSSNGSVDLFGWVGTSGNLTGVAQYGISNTTSSSPYGTSGTDVLKSDWGNTIGPGWRTLTNAEWTWLLGPSSSPSPGTNCRTSSTIGGKENARWLKATVHSVKGLIIFPDDFTWNATSMGTAPTTCNKTSDGFTHVLTDAQWTALEAAGAVFLPAAGYRSGAANNNINSAGYYWYSTPEETNAYHLSFNSTSVLTNSSSRYTGLSVRLVHDAN